MYRTILLRALVVVAVSVALAGTPKSSFAQHGGHGGGGGFHGRGGGFHGGGFGGHAGGGFHGGGGFGNSHGSGGFGGFRGDQGFNGFHNRGFGGFRGGRGFRGDRFFGGFGGYPFFYGFDFGFSPYWGAYPYWYGYGPWRGPYAYYSPYDYPDYPYDTPSYRYPRDNRDHRCRPDYRHPDRCNDGSPDTSKPKSENPPARPANTLGPESSPERNYVTTNFADYRTVVSDDRAAETTIATAAVADRQPANSVTQQLPAGVPPAVRNSIEALRTMPPDSRERQLNSGRYDAFSPEERELLKICAASKRCGGHKISASRDARQSVQQQSEN